MPLALEWLGWLPPSYSFQNGTLVLLPRMLHLTAIPTVVALVITAMTILLTAAIALSHIQRDLADAERQLQVHLWQLEHLVRAGTKRSRS